MANGLVTCLASGLFSHVLSMACSIQSCQWLGQSYLVNGLFSHVLSMACSVLSFQWLVQSCLVSGLFSLILSVACSVLSCQWLVQSCLIVFCSVLSLLKCTGHSLLNFSGQSSELHWSQSSELFWSQSPELLWSQSAELFWSQSAEVFWSDLPCSALSSILFANSLMFHLSSLLCWLPAFIVLVNSDRDRYVLLLDCFIKKKIIDTVCLVIYITHFVSFYRQICSA